MLRSKGLILCGRYFSAKITCKVWIEGMSGFSSKNVKSQIPMNNEL